MSIVKRIVGFSGGADSQATALWCRQNFDPADVILVNSDAGGNEHPITTSFIKWYSDTIHQVVMISPQVQDMAGRAAAEIEARGLKPSDPLTFDLMAELKGVFPRKKMQFCTTHLKLYPQLRWMDEHFPPTFINGVRQFRRDVERYAGVRRDESESRKDVADGEYDDVFGCWLNRPIAAWTKAEVFDYLKANGEEVNPLYRMGFSRVGCAPCVNSGKGDIHLWAVRSPEMIDKIRAWEARVNLTFFPPIIPCKPFINSNGKTQRRRHAFVDEVVEWSKTVRGGRQYALPVLEADVESGMCMSHYGLCE
ncbi:phosphoadenosine phosphosulfate reductase family protein [Singulisphaera sp. PoT]|uniref:phosphoadenosine phosphosulfate reductase family protein n=1 Tax=Singulisphaera sp. PoT TaxID=3411797 RepID=UPI003BF4F84B